MGAEVAMVAVQKDPVLDFWIDPVRLLDLLVADSSCGETSWVVSDEGCWHAGVVNCQIQSKGLRAIDLVHLPIEYSEFPPDRTLWEYLLSSGRCRTGNNSSFFDCVVRTRISKGMPGRSPSPAGSAEEDRGLVSDGNEGPCRCPPTGTMAEVLIPCDAGTTKSEPSDEPGAAPSCVSE